ncbi:MAG: 50S ribosomal protein L32 [Chloroflexi bacterium]|nr:50S ribosomal protein L32 [Chloroflexota bacterium]
MAPLPKRKTSKARHGVRRSHIALTPPATEACPQCHSLKLSHTVCPTCGNYGGEEIIKSKGKKSS